MTTPWCVRRTVIKAPQVTWTTSTLLSEGDMINNGVQTQFICFVLTLVEWLDIFLAWCFESNTASFGNTPNAPNLELPQPYTSPLEHKTTTCRMPAAISTAFVMLCVRVGLLTLTMSGPNPNSPNVPF